MATVAVKVVYVNAMGKGIVDKAIAAVRGMAAMNIADTSCFHFVQSWLKAEQ